MGYVMLDRGNTNGGVYHYQSGTDGDQPERDEIEWWGMPPIVYTLERVARLWADDGHPRIQIGDMTRPQGGTYWRLTDEDYVDDGREDYVSGNYVAGQENGLYSEEHADGNWYKIDHRSHRRGWVADIRPMVGTEEDVGQPLLVVDEAYDRELSNMFLEMLDIEAPRNRGESMLIEVLFDDDRVGDFSFLRTARGHNDHYHVEFNFTPTA